MTTQELEEQEKEEELYNGVVLGESKPLVYRKIFSTPRELYYYWYHKKYRYTPKEYYYILRARQKQREKDIMIGLFDFLREKVMVRISPKSLLIAAITSENLTA